MCTAEITRNNIITGRNIDAVSTLGLESVSPAKKSYGPGFDSKLPGSATKMSDTVEGSGFIEEQSSMGNVFTWKDPHTGDTKVTVV